MRFALPAFLMMSATFPAFAQDKATPEAVLAASKAAFAGSCWSLSEEGIANGAPSEPPVPYKVTVPGEDGAEAADFVVWEVLCDMAAYNVLYIYWVEGEYIGLKPLSFPMPVFQAEMERPEDPDSPVKSLAVTSWTARDKLVNPAFDPATLTFSHFSKYRGIGDASESGTWVLGYEAANLLTFEVDASYDGEINPIPLFPAP